MGTGAPLAWGPEAEADQGLTRPGTALQTLSYYAVTLEAALFVKIKIKLTARGI